MSLTIDELKTLDRLYQQGLDLPAEARLAWIDSLLPEHSTLAPILRAELLAGNTDAGIETADFLGTLPKLPVAQAMVDESGALINEPAAGERVGPYQLVRRLGEGGMSSVWLAQRVDGTVKREVALKLPHRHLLDRGLAERMRRERDILAGLNHDAIARLYDAGIDAHGRPYLALEYVVGEPIHTYCAATAVDLAARVRLMVQAVQAVAHAHANLVVHRDLKPNNILVTTADTAPRVKLLDFGIGKLLTRDEDPGAERDLTQTFGNALTPDYASPEQVLEQPVTTASDIYSLGVVLYEVVTGEKPYKLKRQSAAALAQSIISADILRPSQRSASGKYRSEAKHISGDLDAIILKALKPLAAERYATASALADDLQRYLAHQPVLAQPDSFAYRARRYVRRNALVLGGATAVASALLLGTAVALWQAREARLETAKTKAVKDFLTRVFVAGNADQEDAARRRRQPIGDLLLESAQKLPAELGDQPVIKSELQATLGKLLNDMGLAEPAKKLREERLREVDARPAPLFERMQARVDLAMSVADTGDMQRCSALLQEVVVGLNGVRGAQSRAVLAEASIHLSMAKVFLAGGKGAVEDANRAIELAEAAKPGSEPHVRALYALGFAHAFTNDLAAAEIAFGKALPLAQLLPGDEGIVVADIHTRWGDALNEHHQPGRALHHYRQALAVVERFSGSGSFRWALNATMLANMLAKSGEAATAEKMFRDAITIFEKFGAEVEPQYISAAHMFLTGALIAQGRLAEARIEAWKGYLPYKNVSGPQDNTAPVARAATHYGYLIQLEGDYAASDKVLKPIISLLEAVGGQPPRGLFIVRRLVASNAAYAGDFETARALLEVVISGDETSKNRFGAERDLASIALAMAFVDQGKLTEADNLLRPLSSQLTQLSDDDRAHNFYALAQIDSALGALRLKQGDAVSAVGHFRRSIDILLPRQHPQSPFLASARADLALALATQGARQQAKALVEQARSAFAAHPVVAPHLRRSLAAADKLLNKTSR